MGQQYKLARRYTLQNHSLTPTAKKIYTLKPLSRNISPKLTRNPSPKAPNRENLICSSSSSSSREEHKEALKNLPPELSMESLQRTMSDISLELITKQALDRQDHKHDHEEETKNDNQDLLAIAEADEVKCECCGMSEECTSDYVSRVRGKFSGKLICGLCAEAVGEEMEKTKAKRDEALKEHMSACLRFNKLERTYPVLFQAEAIKVILKKSSTSTNGGTISTGANSVSPQYHESSIIGQRKGTNGALARSSSCIPAMIRKELDDH